MTPEDVGRDVTDTRSASPAGWPRVRSELRSWLPPVKRREFWAVQVLVLAIAGLHYWVEYQHIREGQDPVYLYLVPTMLYLIPVVYAAVTFGLRGAALTALWSAVLVVPNVVLLHEGLERVGELVQVMWIGIVAVFVGARVDRERSARLEAEFRAERQRVSEERYRAIVNNVGEPIILLDASRHVIEANAAAANLLGGSVGELRGRALPGAAGAEIRAVLERPTGAAGVIPRMRIGDPPRWFRPVRMETTDAGGAPTTQLLLLDVTESFEREQGLEGITRGTITAREEERRRIARDLHDGPLQSLLTLWRELDTAAGEVPEASRDRLLRARETTETVADELRRVSRDLRPSVLDDLGIAVALRAEAERVHESSGLATEVYTRGDPRRLDPEVELALLRIGQEALRNVERHARATGVDLELAFEPTSVRLRITDDGSGLPDIPTASALLAGSHLGLIGMQERARMVGGALDLSSRPGHGLEVRVEIPTPRQG